MSTSSRRGTFVDKPGRSIYAFFKKLTFGDDPGGVIAQE